MITSPAFDLRNDITHPYSGALGYKTSIYSNNRQLLVSKREVILIKGSTVSKKLTYDEDVVTSTYTTFSNSDSDALVVCLKKSAYLYFHDGTSYVVSFPFVLKKAFPFESGLILEKDQSQPNVNNFGHVDSPQFNAAKFLTLVDPIDDFKIVTTSSTSIISPLEEMMWFPKAKMTSICATYNPHDKSIILYHIRNSRSAKKSTSTKYQKHQKSLITTPNPSRILEDDNGAIDATHITSGSQPALSLNMDKKRTSTLLSGVSSMARMGSEPGFTEPTKSKSSFNALEFSAFRKDMILTRVDTLHPKARKSQLTVYGISYEDQEAIIVSNRSVKETYVYIFSHSSTSSIPRYQSCYTFRCNHAIPLNNINHPGWLLVLKNDHMLCMVHPFLDIHSPSIDLSGNYPGITTLLSSYDDELAILTNSGKTYIVTLVLEPSSALVQRCMQVFKYLSGSKLDQTVWAMWRSSLMLDGNKNDWKAFTSTLLAITYDFQKGTHCVRNEVTELLPQAKKLSEAFNLNYSFTDLIPYIVLSLHLIYEEMKLDALAEKSMNQVGVLLTQYIIWMGWHDKWTKYYMIDHQVMDKEVRFLSVLVLEFPPNLLESLTSLFTHKIIRYLTFSQLVEESDSVDELITPRTHKILKLFELIVSPDFGPSDVVDLMCEFGITMSDLETYPAGIYVPLKECISICQENPAFEWNSKTLELVGRKDLSMLLNSKSQPVPLYNNFSNAANYATRRDVNNIVANILDKNDYVVAWDGQSEADRINITKLIFDQDRRYYEITTLLHQTRTQTATLVTEENIGEYDIVLLQRELAALVALRTLSIPMGRAALFFAGRMPLLTEKFPIPKFNLNTLIAPTMTNIILSEGTINEGINEWGYFHNGVSSGLSISKESKGISGSWIIFNKPPELNSQHAGFLLGLGLNGHLKKLEEWHIYNYLGPKHPLTSVGLLIGMAASLKGSMDNKLTKVLSVHAVALLPQGANDLNVPIMVQTAGLIGIGLLYLETQHRRMSEILLSQLHGSVFQNDNEEIHEGYRLSAGLALGFVNLGKGDDLRGLNDTHVIDKLLSLGTSMKDYQPVQELDKSSSGALLALGFIYMKTENKIIANKLKVPASEQLLDYVRSDLLLLRCVAKNLIMWESIGETIEWVESEIPESLLKKYSLGVIEVLDSDQLPYFNILGGACLSMAVKYASSHNIKARDTLLHFLDVMMVISMSPANNYDQKTAYNSASNIQNLLALCLSLVMAGSGDLETFRRLRILHSETHKEMGYGNYQAINMALGFLFLGGGQYAFANSNFAIACLLISLYPVYPNENTDYEIHLQALRHFWALSAEPRCLVIRDVNTRKASKIPVIMHLKNGEMIETLSPCLLPHLDEIISISTKSPDHFNVKVDFELNSEYLEIFKKSLTIFVYKRRNYQLLKSSVNELLNNENKLLQIQNGEIRVNSDVFKFLNLNLMKNSNDFEKQVFLYESISDHSESDPQVNSSGLSIFNIIDNKIELERMATKPKTIQDLWNIKLLFAFSDRLLNDQLHYVSLDFIEQLKQQVWDLANN